MALAPAPVPVYVLTMFVETVPTRGRKTRDLMPQVLGALTREDMERLNGERGVQPKSLVERLSSRHHSLARAVATGISDWEASLITGYTPSRISILKTDPTFKSLVSFYQAQVEEKYIEVHDRLSEVTLAMTDIILERAENAPDSITNDEVNQFLKTAADRTGYGPSSKSEVNVTVGIASRLEAARKRVKQLNLVATEVQNGSDNETRDERRDAPALVDTNPGGQ